MSDLATTSFSPVQRNRTAAEHSAFTGKSCTSTVGNQLDVVQLPPVSESPGGHQAAVTRREPGETYSKWFFFDRMGMPKPRAKTSRETGNTFPHAANPEVCDLLL
jgi:hypothetical protein